MSKPWDILEEFRGSEFRGEWPTIPEMFSITAKKYPDNMAFTCFYPEKLHFTYNEAFKMVKKISYYLLSLGIKKGDKVALTGKNSPEWAIAYLAILEMGGVVVPLDYGLSNEDITGLIERSDSKVIFSESDKIEEIKAACPKLLDIVSLNRESDHYILDIECDTEMTLVKAAVDDVAAILYTSGTTGVSKGVMLTHRNFSSDVWLAQGNLTIYSTDIFYALLPIHHSYTMTAVFLEAIYCGAEIVFGKQLVFAQILKDFKQGRVTMFLGVPMLFNKIINGLLKGVKKKGAVVYGIIRFLMTISGIIKKTFNRNPGKKMFGFILKQASLENIRICISGGGPLAPSTFRLFNQLGIDFVQGYGLTETAPIVALNPKEHYKETSVGKILEGVDVKIINKDEHGLGDIVVKGPNVMKGYYKQDDKTNEVFTEDGYLITGDAGYLDRENYLYLTGRKASLIVTEGGKNIYPEELEDAFQLYDEFEQVLVKGYIKNSETMSEGIEVVFYPTDEFVRSNSVEEMKLRFGTILLEVNRGLTSYKHIDRFHLVKEALPMTTTKKIKRNEVGKIFDTLEKY